MPQVKQSASKGEFLRTLSLNEGDPNDKLKFQLMWEEVTGYWVRVFEVNDRNLLKPEYAHNQQVRRPFKWAHLRAEVIDRAIAEIWARAGQAPLEFYEIGRSSDQRVKNWVLKWLLWHVCRYRDWRNRKASTTRAGNKVIEFDPGNPSSGSGGSGAGPDSGSDSGSGSSMPPHDFWATVMNSENTE